MTSFSRFTNDDLSAVAKLSAEFLDEAKILDNAPLDFNTMLQTLLNTISNKDWFGLLARVDSVPAGMVIARRIGLFFSTRNIACDVVFFVRAQFRGSLIIRRLVKEYERWAFLDEDCVGVQLNAFAGNNDRGTKL